MSYMVGGMERFAYSVRELVDKLAPEGDETEKLRLIRQIRHWTNADLLTPQGKKHTGTGVSRQYGPDEVRKAAILRELGRFGMTVTQLEGMGEYLDGLAEDPSWRDAITGKRPVYLELFSTPDDEEQTWRVARDEPDLKQLHPDAKPLRIKIGTKHTNGASYTSALVLSLNRIFARLSV